MILPEVALTACLLLNVSPSVVKKCEKLVIEKCFEKKQMRSYKDCNLAISTDINVLMKKQYAKACLLE
jgi:hypothetical protein